MNSAVLSFRIGPVPVTIRLSIVLMLAFIGYLVDPTSLTRIGVWTAIGLASILLHEMGHAAAALAFGGQPKVQLMGLGGATDPGLTARPGRLRSAVLSLSGPGAGLVVGVLVWVLSDPDFESLGTEKSLGAFALATVLWMNVGWSLLNLLPVLPLDGGRLLTEALPGDPATRSRRAYLASSLLGVVVACGLLFLHQLFAAVIFGFLASQSFTAWRLLRARNAQTIRVTRLRDLHHRLGKGDERAEATLASMVEDPHDGPIARTMLIDHFARTGRGIEADRLSSALTATVPTATFLVEVMQSQGEQGVESLIEAFRRAPSTLAAQHLVLGLDAAGLDDRIVDVVERAATTADHVPMVMSAQHCAHQVENYGVAAELGAHVYRIDPRANGLAAFNVACSLAREGQDDAALGWIDAAVKRGLPDPAMLDADPDLTDLRASRAFVDARRRAFES